MADKYVLTDEHRKKLKPWADKWIANAMSTRPMDDAERTRVREAIIGLYEAADLEPPPAHRIIFVPSPLVAALAGGFAAWIWHLRGKGSQTTNEALEEAVYEATSSTAEQATDSAAFEGANNPTSKAEENTDVEVLRGTEWAVNAGAGKAVDEAIAAVNEAVGEATKPTSHLSAFRAAYGGTRKEMLEAADIKAASSVANETLQAIKDATNAATDLATDDAVREDTRAARAAMLDPVYEERREATKGVAVEILQSAEVATRNKVSQAVGELSAKWVERAMLDATMPATELVREAVFDAENEATFAAYVAAKGVARKIRGAAESAAIYETAKAVDDLTKIEVQSATVLNEKTQAIRASRAAASDAITGAATFKETHEATQEVAFEEAHEATEGIEGWVREATEDAARNEMLKAVDKRTMDEVQSATLFNEKTLAIRAALEVTDDAMFDAAEEAAYYGATLEKQQNWYSWTDIAGIAKRTLGAFWKGGVLCAASAWRMRSGGNQWSGYAAYISFFRHVVNLPIDYSKWMHWETAAEAGPRVMHEKFCFVSERPEVLLVDEQNRPHCEDGPFCRWRDGWALYSWHGVRTPQWVIEHPELITPDKIFDEDNAEVRRVMIERYGKERLINDERVQFIDRDEDHLVDYYLVTLGGEGVVWGLIGMTCKTTGKFTVEWANPDHPSALAAVAASFGMTAEEYAPEIET